MKIKKNTHNVVIKSPDIWMVFCLSPQQLQDIKWQGWATADWTCCFSTSHRIPPLRPGQHLLEQCAECRICHWNAEYWCQKGVSGAKQCFCWLYMSTWCSCKHLNPRFPSWLLPIVHTAAPGMVQMYLTIHVMWKKMWLCDSKVQFWHLCVCRCQRGCSDQSVRVHCCMCTVYSNITSMRILVTSAAVALLLSWTRWHFLSSQIDVSWVLKTLLGPINHWSPLLIKSPSLALPFRRHSGLTLTI